LSLTFGVCRLSQHASWENSHHTEMWNSFFYSVILMTFSWKITRRNCFQIASRSPGDFLREEISFSSFLCSRKDLLWCFVAVYGSRLDTSIYKKDMITFQLSQRNQSGKEFKFFNCSLLIIDKNYKTAVFVAGFETRKLRKLKIFETRWVE
jgi:hypothetical protein